MPDDKDCIEWDNGTPGNMEFLLGSHVCKIGKSPKKQSWCICLSCEALIWVLSVPEACFLTAPLFCLQCIAGILPLIQPDTREARQLLFCSAAAALKIASACFGSTSNLWKLTEKKVPVSGWATYDSTACPVHLTRPPEMHHWKFKILPCS